MTPVFELQVPGLGGGERGTSSENTWDLGIQLKT